jgi:hypothetical protein
LVDESVREKGATTSREKDAGEETKIPIAARILCMATNKKSASNKRTLITPHKGDSRYIKRDAKGRIKESDDVGRSLRIA